MAGELSQINERTILAQYGPMRLTIQTWEQAEPSLRLAALAGEYAFSLLPRIAGAGRIFRRGAPPVAKPMPEPLLESMRQAAAQTDQAELGPMAAVAGAVADEVALWLEKAGASKAIVENGGDIALFLTQELSATVGIRRSLMEKNPHYALELQGAKARHWGIATSGANGGRGMSLGLADAAVCVAESAAVADAAATAICNSCNIVSAAVRRVPAEHLNPDTDIPGLMVTAEIGVLSSDEIETALEQAKVYAQSLVEKKRILGAFIHLRGREKVTEEFAANIAPLTEI